MPSFDEFWRFTHDRYDLYVNRLLVGEPVPSGDPVLDGNRFTNTFRVTDRVSQRLLRIQAEGPQDPESLVLRTLLFKVFNKEATWDAIVAEFGEPSWPGNWDPARLNSLLAERGRAGEKVFTGSYMMVNPLTKGWVKHEFYVDMIHTVMTDYLPAVLGSQSLRELVSVLNDVPGIGDFLAYQYAIDLNYTSLFGFSENDYVLPGHGARRGIVKLYGNGRMAPARIMELALQRDRGPLLRGQRPMHLTDLQNMLCEYDKYTRAAGGMKQRYRPDPRPLPDPIFPPSWRL